jgi:hypothetical protein
MSTRETLLPIITGTAGAVALAVDDLRPLGLRVGTADASHAIAALDSLELSSAALRAMLDEVQTTPPVPVPSPAPVPTEPPAPVPAPLPAGAVWRMRRTMQPLACVLFEGGEVSSRYEREQRPVIWQAGARTVRVFGYAFDGGRGRPLIAPEYTLVVRDAMWREVFRATRERVHADVSFDVPALAEGWYWLDCEQAGIETTYVLPVYVRHGAQGVSQPTMPWLTHSHRFIHPTVGKHEEQTWKVPKEDRYTIHWAMVPAQFAPITQPLPPRECPPFTAIDTDRGLYCAEIAPERAHSIDRPNLTADGVLTTSGSEAYHFADFVDSVPHWALLDGPRGRGTVTAPTHLQIGRDGKIYGTDPWRMFKVGVDGQVTTLVGWRHAGIPSNHRAPQNLELVGDWSAVQGPKGLHEAWGMAWDERTLTVDESAPIPPGEIEAPHVTGPVAFIADTQNNRVLRVEFSAVSHAVPAKVTEFLTELRDPWDVLCDAGELFVSERLADRIAVYDASTGAYLRTFAQGPSVGFVDGNRKARASVPLSVARQHDIGMPEGLYLLDGKVYAASLTQAAVTIFDRATGARVGRQHLDGALDGNSLFCKIAVSDGTFYERGTLAVCSWSNNRHGYPNLIKPDGTQVQCQPNRPGRGKIFAGGAYATACAIGQGRLVAGFINEGLLQVSHALTGDLPMPAEVPAGALEYWREGYHATHGHKGWGHYGLPLPWGVSPAMDSWLTYCGHVRTEQ